MKCAICGGVCVQCALQGSYKYFQCTQCFTSQLLPQPTARQLAEFYDAYHLSADDGGLYDDVEARMQADFPTKARMIRKFVRVPSPRLIDVGCGKGYFIKEIEKLGFHAEGIDMSKSGVKFAIEQLGVKASIGQIEDLPLANTFDAAVLWATIEHVLDPLKTLTAVFHCLKSGGFLFLDTGLGNAPFESFLAGHSQWYDAPQHPFVFSQEGLLRLLQDAGFTVLNVDTNFERSPIRRWIKALRHAALCVAPYFVVRPLVGARGWIKLKEEAKWPLGRLISIVAQKK